MKDDLSGGCNYLVLSKDDLEEVDYSVDPVGKIFFYKGRVLRGISRDCADQVRGLMESGLVAELIEKDLFPNTWVSELAIEEFGFVIEHERLEFWNYSYEWSFDMLKTASLAIVEINEIANSYGYELTDCHASNVIFNFNKPVYVDLGSFKKTDNIAVWGGKDIFMSSYYIPLVFNSLGYRCIAKNLTLSVDYFDYTEFCKFKYPYIPYSIVEKYQKARSLLQRLLTSTEKEIQDKVKSRSYEIIAKIVKNNLTFLGFNNKKAKALILGLEGNKLSSTWGGYHDDVEASESERFNRVVDIVNELAGVETVVELAANQGKLSAYLLNNSNINGVIATDYDQNAVNKMYQIWWATLAIGVGFYEARRAVI